MITASDPFTHPDPQATRRIAILGAGPVGLDAALAARGAGFTLRVYEVAPHPAGHVRQWGHVRLFSPWPMNLSARMHEGLRTAGAAFEPDPTASPTGHEYADQVLDPLWRSALLEGTLRTGIRVLAVSRQGTLKHEAIGSPERARRPFRVLLGDGSGDEWMEFADVVLDCTGSFGHPNPLGDGGIPAPGERGLDDRITRRIPDLDHEASEWEGRRILLVGGGHSGQTAARELDRLARRRPGMRVMWALRGDGQALEPIQDDPLPYRHALTREAGELAAGGSNHVDPRRGVVVDALESVGGSVRATLRSDSGAFETVEVDRILALTGGVGDASIYRQLQVHECYATSGPMKLAARLLSEGSGADCLEQGSHGIETLTNPEPGFYIVGEKSYGRNNTFLLQVGWSQVDEIFGALGSPRAGTP